MCKSQNLQDIKDHFDLLAESLGTNSLSTEERTKLLHQMRVLLSEMDSLALAALNEKKEETIELPL
jgi:hypothetical protein